MSVAKKESKIYTYEDILNLPEGERAELIDGKLYMMASPSINHQIVSFKIAQKIQNYIDSKNGNCVVLTAPSDVKLFKDKDDIVEPDMYIVCDTKKLSGNKCIGAPDMVVEVLSPSSISRDVLLKYNKYMESGVREYWVVDIESRLINVYNFEKPELSGYSFEDEIPVGIFNGDCSVCLRNINLIEE